MDHNFPFRDLNCALSSTVTPFGAAAALSSGASAIAAAATFSLKTPKVEPKPEPIDYLFDLNRLEPQNPHQDPYFPDFAPGFHLNPQFTPPSQPADYGGNYTPFPDHNQQNGSVSSSNSETGAIVLRDDEPSDASAIMVSRSKQRYLQRSGELVRIGDMGADTKRYFRSNVRRTRMTFDALRIFSAVEAESRRFDMDPIDYMSLDGEMGPTPLRRQRYIRGDLLAASLMRERGMWLYRDKRIVGPVPGIEVGDPFLFRVELCVLGLHGQMQAGIDYLPANQSSNGEPIATSIIVSGGYEDNEDAGDVIIYTGHGGQEKKKQVGDQVLEGGNLALERSMRYGIEVRVIRGIKYDVGGNKVYVYDGLYKIHDCWFDVGKSGFGVYKYRLMRIDGQPVMGSLRMKFASSLRSSPLSVRSKGYCSLDISNGKENVPVFLFNDLDNNYDPMCYDYLTKTVFPPFLLSLVSPGAGCDCVSGCGDGCFCVMKNAGKLAYDPRGFLLRGKPVIFECGSFCRCPPSCRNRVSQNGLTKRLEVFRSKETGWGVRTLDLIHAGAFICEYTAIILTREQVELFTMNGDTLIYPSRFASKCLEWGDLSTVYSDYIHPSSPSLPPLDFAMDVSRMRNVACYISHSSTPNVLVQFVLYDHNNLMFPHLMLFAMENIPPLGELSLDYGVADEYTGKLAICN